MKITRFIAVFALAAAPLLAAAQVAPGDSLADVRAELGVPRGARMASHAPTTIPAGPPASASVGTSG